MTDPDFADTSSGGDPDGQPEPELVRTLLDHSSDGFYVIDPETSEIIDVNETACQLLGYDRDELRSLSVPDINPAFSMEMWDDFAETVREQGSTTIEGEHRRKDGSTVPVEIEVRFVSLENDYHVASVRDITDRKERDRVLRRERENLEQTERLAKAGGWVYDVETGQLSITSGLRRLLEFPDDYEWTLQESFEYYHPEDRDRLIHAFERCRRYGRPYEIELRMITHEGRELWVHERGERTDEGAVRGAIRDISKQKRYENSLEGINTAARDLLADQTDTETAHTTVTVGSEILDADYSVVYLYDDAAGELYPAAYSESVGSSIGELPRISPGDNVVWRVFTTQEPERFDDVRIVGDRHVAGTPIRSELLVPLGEHGVFLVGDRAVGAFDDLTVEIVGTLAATAEAALDRADRTQELRERERTSQLQAQRLDRIRQLNDKIRSITQALVQARSHEAITQQVCDSLAALEHFEYVWIGQPDFEAGTLAVDAWAGSPPGYTDAIDRDLAAESSQPEVKAIQTRSTVTESNIASSPHGENWRSTALVYEFRSVISVPLEHDGILYGVITIYSGRPGNFDELTISVLSELGELIGYALNMADQRSALLEGNGTDVTIELSGEDAFIELASELSSEIRIENIIPRSQDRYLVHFVTEGADIEELRSIADAVPAIGDVRLLSGTEPPLYEAILLGDCMATSIADAGANLRSAVVSESSCLATVSLPDDRGRDRYLRHLKEQYPSVSLTASQQGSSPPSMSWFRLLEESLTDRQRDILAAAYYSGFFDRPRNRTGAEIAESLGISQPAFSKQLRAAQSNLLDSVFSDRSYPDPSERPRR